MFEDERMNDMKKKRTIVRIAKITARCTAAVLIVMGLLVGEGLTHEAMAPDMWMAPEQEAHLENPVPAEADSITRGKEIYLQNCSACHGENAEGLDPQAVGLEKKPPNLKERISMHPDGDFFWKIKTGRGEMPSFEEELTGEEIWDVINHIKNEAN